MRFADDHDIELEYVILNNTWDGDISNGLQVTDWAQLSEFLLGHQPVNNKNNTRAIIPAVFKDEEDWVVTQNSTSAKPTYRNMDNVSGMSLVIFDLDEPGAKEAAQNLFKDQEHIIYSTYSYSEEKPYKFRMVLPLKEPIPASEWSDIFDQTKKCFDADEKCRDLSRIYYLPSYPSGSDITPVSEYHSGELLTKELLLELTSDYLLKNPEKEVAQAQKPKNLKFGVRTDDANKFEHFADGVLYNNQRSNGPNSPDYESMLNEDHLKYSVDKYLRGERKDESRHYFALSASNNELTKNGEDVNLHNLVQFIYRASQEFSSPITAGDTGSELPEIIGSAALKQAPHFIDKHYDGSVQELVKDVYNEVYLAQKSEKNDEWTFEDLSLKQDDYSYQNLKERHNESIKKFFGNLDHTTFAENVFNNEIALKGEDVDIIKTSELVYKASLHLQRSHPELNGNNLEDDIKEIKNKLQEAKIDHESAGLSSSDFNRYLWGSSKVAEQCALKDLNWSVSPSADQNKSPSI